MSAKEGIVEYKFSNVGRLSIFQSLLGSNIHR